MEYKSRISDLGCWLFISTFRLISRVGMVWCGVVDKYYDTVHRQGLR